MLRVPDDTASPGRATRQENGLRNNRRHHLLISPQNIYLLGQAIYTYWGWAVYVLDPVSNIANGKATLNEKRYW